MGSRDTSRVAYRDGALLEAGHLSGDQAYFRAALERRALAHDMFGIAFGLELELAHLASRPDLGIPRVRPGVAYGGDGKTIVVPTPEDLSPLLRGRSTRNASYAVYLFYAEREDESRTRSAWPGATSAPWIVESYGFALEADPQPFEPEGHREGPRLEPHAELAGQRDPALGRIRLGVIDFDVEGKASVRVPAPRDPRGATPPEPARGEAVAVEGAQYVGLIGAAIAHPRAWAAAQGGALSVAMELDPRQGVIFHHEVSHRAPVLFSDRQAQATFAVTSAGGVLSIGACAAKGVEPLLEAAKDAVTVKTELSVAGAAAFQGKLTASELVCEKLTVGGVPVTPGALAAAGAPAAARAPAASGAPAATGAPAVSGAPAAAGAPGAVGAAGIALGLVARGGIEHEIPIEPTGTNIERRAVVWGSVGVRPALTSDSAGALGIVTAVEGQMARVMLIGVTKARVIGAIQPGDWLALTDADAGALRKAPSREAGTLVAMALEPAGASGGEIDVLVWPV
ncbi:hypothetical protein [Sorangium sp. So ce117]|uniref:hypothetical protein n=1 Tax=Sorangium sp. So ce117 TaxID=3133277 RepID=UPI003F5FEC59